MFFELVSILFVIVPDCGNEYTTKENKNWISLKFLHQNLIQIAWLKLRDYAGYNNYSFSTFNNLFFN